MEDNRRFLERRLRQFATLKKTSKNTVKVGLPSDSGDHKPPDGKGKSTPESVSLVLIGAANEFGTEDGHIPERSFLRSTVTKNKEKYKKLSKKIAKQIIDNPEDFKKLLSKIGLVAQGDVQNTIRNLSEPPNALATIAKKGADNPLVDTGQLGSAITFVVNDKKDHDIRNR